ncbi:MAG: cob(I)yrinic acid a,c-diamide adenosyltransferase [Candidatus Woesebacteria bacterium]|nr:MAG: cob(I)yrinic acid a,c-diamide adenosyltransferase [Candidatus Woesebacteria bacterium]
MSIYTKKGDKGVTRVLQPNLGTGLREISKDSLQITAIGNIDELNSYIGVCISNSESRKLSEFLKKIQRNLLNIGSILAGSGLAFSAENTKELEDEIDSIDKRLPKLTNFILPGGSRTAAHLQYARTLARRAERGIVSFSKTEKLNSNILTYMNRLSDCLFMLSRYQNFLKKNEEEIWVGKKI